MKRDESETRNNLSQKSNPTCRLQGVSSAAEHGRGNEGVRNPGSENGVCLHFSQETSGNSTHLLNLDILMTSLDC